MKILFIIPPPYLPNRLHRIRSFDLIKILSQKHEVHLFAVTTKKEKPAEFEEIKKTCKSVTVLRLPLLKAILNCFCFPHLPYEVAYCYSKEAKEKIKQIIKKEKIEFVYTKRLRSAIFLPKVSIPVVIDTTDAMSIFYKRMFKNHNFPKNLFYLLEAIKYRRFERKTMEKIKDWVVCSETDKKYLETISSSVKIEVVPNPVDTSYFQFQPITPLRSRFEGQANHQSPITNHSLLFRGLMDKPVNIDAAIFFAKEIFPKVLQRVKDAKLFIVGSNPHPKILRLANKRDIVVTGFVKDVRGYINNTQISVCPIRIGTGARHKILQAWGMGRPVVSTSIGAEGLLYKDGENIEIADDPKTFAGKIIMLFENKNQYNKLAKNGRKTVELNYRFGVVSRKLDKVLSYAVKNQKSN